jgi:hypothetical protein
MGPCEHNRRYLICSTKEKCGKIVNGDICLPFQLLFNLWFALEESYLCAGDPHLVESWDKKPAHASQCAPHGGCRATFLHRAPDTRPFSQPGQPDRRKFPQTIIIWLYVS